VLQGRTPDKTYFFRKDIECKKGIERFSGEHWE
jgi:hypothetical protein